MEEQTNETLLSDKISILAELWMHYRSDEEFIDFVEYNDLGLPLAYAIDNNIVELTPSATAFIEETFDLFVQILDVEKDDGPWETLDDMLGIERFEE